MEDGPSTRRAGTKKDERKCNNSNTISDLEIANRLGGCYSDILPHQASWCYDLGFFVALHQGVG